VLEDRAFNHCGTNTVLRDGTRVFYPFLLGDITT